MSHVLLVREANAPTTDIAPASVGRTSLEKYQALTEGMSGIDLSGLATLILAIIYLDGASKLNTPILTLGVAGLVFAGLRRRAELWLFGAAILIARHYHLWHSLDNHQWLMTYWFLALGLSRLSPNPALTVALSARLLIGGCFLFAVVWKVISRDFLGGGFFELTLLTDRRFSGVARAFGQMSSQDLSSISRAVTDLLTYAGQIPPVPFEAPAGIRVLARLLTIWTIAIESLVAAAFLVRPSSALGRARHVILLAFVMTTYPIAPIVGFGWILLAMALASQPEPSTGMRTAYLAAFALLPLLGVVVDRLLT